MSELLLQNLESTLQHLEVIPLYGSPPPFPFEEFASALSSSFQVDPIKITITKTDFHKHPLEGMGQLPFIRPFVLSPLPEELFLVFPKSELNKLVGALLTKSGSKKEISDDSLKESFLEVALLAACQSFNQLNPFGNLSVAFADLSPFPEEGALCQDLSIQIAAATITARLVCSTGGVSAFRSFYEMENPPLIIQPENAQIPLSLSYDVGQVSLAASEWQEAKVGDCLLLDRCTLDLENGKGTAILASSVTPLFHVRIKGTEAKILDYAMTQKESTMTDELPPLPNNSQELEEKPLPADQIPITVTVEVGHFQMPLEKVTQLKPGNVLNLAKSADAGVHLTIGGKLVAIGELVRLGDALGVKILKLGS